MTSAVIGQDGQMTLPEDVRQALGVREGASVDFRIREAGVVELRTAAASERRTSHPLLSLAGMVTPRRKGVTLRDFETAIAEGASGSASRHPR